MSWEISPHFYYTQQFYKVVMIYSLISQNTLGAP